MNARVFKLFLALMIAACVLTACGGGGGDDSDKPNPGQSGNPDDGNDGGANDDGGTPGDDNPPPAHHTAAYTTEHLTTIHAAAVDRTGDGAAPVLGESGTIALFHSGARVTHVEIADNIVLSLSVFDALGLPDPDPGQPGDASLGTAAASLAVGHNIGVAPDVGLVLMKAGKEGLFSPGWTLAALDVLVTQGVDIDVAAFPYAVDSEHDTDCIIQTGEGCDYPLRSAISDTVVNKDWIYIVSAGLRDSDGSRYPEGLASFAGAEPGNYTDQVMGVMAYDIADARIAPFSNWGHSITRDGQVDLFDQFILAPGVQVCAAIDLQIADLGTAGAGDCHDAVSDQLDITTDTAYGRGDSMLAPVALVAGTAGLIRKRYPALDGSAVIDILVDSADAVAIFDPEINQDVPYKLLNVQAALQLAAARAAAPAPAPIAPLASSNQRAASASTPRQPADRSLSAASQAAPAAVSPVHMAPMGIDPESGCRMFSAQAGANATPTDAVYWQTKRGAFTMIRSRCLPTRAGAR